jgi:hypothetical protein
MRKGASIEMASAFWGTKALPPPKATGQDLMMKLSRK